MLDPLEEGAGQVFVEEALAVGAEGGVVPDFVLDVQAHEPAVQQVVVDRFDQLALAADGEQDLQQQALSSISGGTEGRPRRAYTASNSRFIVASSASTTARSLRSGCVAVPALQG